MNLFWQLRSDSFLWTDLYLFVVDAAQPLSRLESGPRLGGAAAL